MDFKSIFNKIKNSNRLMMNLVILFLCGVLLILIGDISSNMIGKKDPEKKNTVEVSSSNDNNTVSSTYEESVKQELTETLSQISGVGKLSVMIYFDGGSQSIPAMNITNNNTRTEEKDNQGGRRVTTENDKNQNIVLVDEGGTSKPFILRQYNPSIGGVVIVAEGASNPIVKERLFISAKTALNLPSNKITVMPMKK